MEETKKKNKKTKMIIGVVIAAILLLSILIGNVIKQVSQGMQEAMEMAMGESEDIYEVSKQDIEQQIISSGTTMGLEKKAYVSPVTAQVKDVCVEVGQTVKKGDVLLKYDTAELGSSLEKVRLQAESEKAAGNASYEAANEAAGKADTARQKAETLEGEIASVQSEIEDLSAQVQKYEEQIKAAEEAELLLQSTEASIEEENDEDTDTTGKKKKNKTTQSASKVDEAAYNEALTQLETKKEELAQKQGELAEQESIVAANEGITVSESQKTQIAAANQLSDLSVSEAQESLNAAEAGITAKKSGIVESIEIVKGAYASESQTLMTIIDGDKIGVEFTISKDDLGSISKGQKAKVVISGTEYEGTVEFISRVAVEDYAMSGQSNSGGSVKGRITIDNPDEKLYLGVSAKVYIFVGEANQALSVPYEALNSDVDGDFVYVVNEENLIERKDVTVGIYSDEYYEIKEGLEEGDKVIRNVTEDMKPGDSYMGVNAAAGVAAE